MIYLGISLIVLAGYFEAIRDTIEHHFNTSIFRWKYFNQKFWNPDLSWLNKYNDVKLNYGVYVPKFYLSTTLLVGLTDAWHLFKGLEKLCRIAGYSMIAAKMGMGIETLWMICASRILEGLVFTVFYSKLLICK